MRHLAPLFLVSLSACTLDSVADTSKVEASLVDVAAGADAEVAPTTGYSLGLETAADVMRASAYAKPCVECLDNLEERIVGLADDATCPVITRSESLIEIVGDCSTPRGVEFVGSMSIRNVDGARITAFQGFEIHDHENNFDVEANGSYSNLGDAEGVDYAFNLTYTWHAGEQSDGRFAYDLDMSTRGGVDTMSGEVMVDAGGIYGTFAVTSSLAEVQSCAIESSGTFALIGANEAVLTLDGAKSCDACGELSIDGAAAESICR